MTAYKKRACDEEEMRKRAEGEADAASEKADEAARAIAAVEKEYAAAVQALRRVLASAHTA